MSKVWQILAFLFLGVALGLCIAFRLRKPETVIRQQIKKLKQRGQGNTQDVEMDIERPLSRKERKKMKREARREGRKQKKAERKERPN